MMKLVRTFVAAGIVLAAMCAGSGIARAQHSFDVVVQQAGGQLVTAGCCNGGSQWFLGKRVFVGEFPDDPSNPGSNDWATNNPGYGAFGTGSPNLPPGSAPPPGNTELFWDFMPMINNGVAQNVFYWNGKRSDGQYGTIPSDVNFGPLPGANYTLSEFDKTSAKFSADGTNSIKAGGDIGQTGPDGSLHFHRYFFLEDNDGDSGTSPPDGIYLIAERFRMNGVLNSDPVFIVFDTSNPALPISVLDDAAVPWVTQHVNMLTGVPGDFNRSGTVDAADYVLWRKTLGQSGNTLMADWNYNNQIDDGDYVVWRNHYGGLPIGGAGAGLGTVAVPEPASSWLFLLASVITGGNVRRRSTVSSFLPRSIWAPFYE